LSRAFVSLLRVQVYHMWLGFRVLRFKAWGFRVSGFRVLGCEDTGSSSKAWVSSPLCPLSGLEFTFVIYVKGLGVGFRVQGLRSCLGFRV
jgi:hypothetical protein